MEEKSRQRLLQVLRDEALLKGEFTLASGRTTDTYLDCRRATLHPEGSNLVAEAMFSLVDEAGLEPDCVGGPTLGADPMVSSMTMRSFQLGRPLPGFLVRKEAKGHGTGRALEGQWQAGWKALILEDTITTGGSVLKAVNLVREAGLDVLAIACIVDRREEPTDRLGDYPLMSVFTGADLGM
jgi:orotate phosphoribosyltransferase